MRPELSTGNMEDDAVLKTKVKNYADRKDIKTKEAWADLVQKGLEQVKSEEED